MVSVRIRVHAVLGGPFILRTFIFYINPPAGIFRDSVFQLLCQPARRFSRPDFAVLSIDPFPFADDLPQPLRHSTTATSPPQAPPRTTSRRPAPQSLLLPHRNRLRGLGQTLQPHPQLGQAGRPRPAGLSEAICHLRRAGAKSLPLWVAMLRPGVRLGTIDALSNKTARRPSPTGGH